MTNKKEYTRDSTGTLCWRGHNLLTFINAFGTPSMIYDECRIIENYKWFRSLDQLLRMKFVVAVAMKATGNIALLKALKEEGAFCEVMSEEEYLIAIAAGFKSHNIIVNGLGWTDSFLEQICTNIPYVVNIDNLEDGNRLNRVAVRYGVIIPVCLRIVPDVDHAFASAKEKLGTLIGNGNYDDIQEILKKEGLDFIGVSVHALHRCNDLMDIKRIYESTARFCMELIKRGISIVCVDLGGGFDFRSEIEGIHNFPEQLALIVNRAFASFQGLILIFEPGRFLVGDAAIILTQVMLRKVRKPNDWLIVDVGTNILVPISTAHFVVDFVRNDEGHTSRFNIADGICSPTSVIATDCILPESITYGDFLSISRVGSYTLALFENWGYKCPSVYFIDRQSKINKIIDNEVALDNFYRSWGVKKKH